VSLTFELREPSSVPIEVEGVTPDGLRELSLAAIEQLPVLHGNCRLPLAELFRVQGSAVDETHIWNGDLSSVHWLGAKMKSGRIEVHGHIGRHLGSEMTGGEIHVFGNAGDWVGAEMHGGVIHVRGSAGDLIGAAYRGSLQGMTEGTILIGGDAGNEIGHSMRRGVLYVAGSIGDFAGVNMRAGTILVGGRAGVRHGAGMKRGTIAFLGAEPPPLLPTFRRACVYRPAIFPLLFRYLRRFEAAIAEEILAAPFVLSHGDRLEGGRGEILLRHVG
jgi:formylmethanofuran dehydrogenase subunit C